MKKIQQKFSWKDFFIFSKYGWVTLFLTLLLGFGIELEMFLLSTAFEILNSNIFWVTIAVSLSIIFLGVLLGWFFKVSEIVSELLSVLPLVLLPLLIRFFILEGLLGTSSKLWIWLVLFIGNQIAVCSFIQLSFARIGSWKLRKKRYDKVKALMLTRKAYDPAIEKYLNLTCDKEIVKKLQKDFEIESTTENFKGEK